MPAYKDRNKVIYKTLNLIRTVDFPPVTPSKLDLDWSFPSCYHEFIQQSTHSTCRRNHQCSTVLYTFINGIFMVYFILLQNDDTC